MALHKLEIYCKCEANRRQKEIQNDLNRALLHVSQIEDIDQRLTKVENKLNQSHEARPKKASFKFWSKNK